MTDNNKRDEGEAGHEHGEGLWPQQRLVDEISGRRDARQRRRRLQLTHFLSHRGRQRPRISVAPNNQKTEWRSRQRKVDGALVGLIDAVVLHVADHSDDGRPIALGATAAFHPLPDRAVVREESPRPRAIDDDRVWDVGLHVTLIQQAAFDQRQTQRLDELRRYRDPRRHRLRLIRRLRFEREVIVLARLVRRHAIRIRDARHAWQRGDSPLQLVPERFDASGILILRARQPNGAGQHLLGLEAHINQLELIEAHEQQARDDQQRRRDRELRANEYLPQAADADAGR